MIGALGYRTDGHVQRARVEELIHARELLLHHFGKVRNGRQKVFRLNPPLPPPLEREGRIVHAEIILEGFMQPNDER